MAGYQGKYVNKNWALELASSRKKVVKICLSIKTFDVIVMSAAKFFGDMQGRSSSVCGGCIHVFVFCLTNFF